MLCRFAQEGDDKAKAELYVRHDGWIHKCANKWNIKGYDADDIYSAALFGFGDAINKFSGDGALTTFSTFTMRKAIDRLRVDGSRIKNGRDYQNISLESMTYDDGNQVEFVSPTLSPETIVVGRDEAKRLYENLCAKYPNKVDIIDAVIANEGDYKDILGDCTNIDYKSLTVLRSRLRKSMSEDINDAKTNR